MKSDQLYFKSSEDWREWLDLNHSTKELAWVIFYKKHTGKPCLDYTESVEEALCYGWIDSLVKRIDDERYMRKFTPRRKGSVWSKYNLDRIKKMLAEGRMQQAGMESIKDVDLDVEGHDSPVKRVIIDGVPDYIYSNLELFPDALSNFRHLAPSHKAAYVGWVMDAKKEATRERRLTEMIEKLKKNQSLGLK